MIKHLIPVPLSTAFPHVEGFFSLLSIFLIYPITMAKVKVVAMKVATCVKDEASDLALSDVFVMLPMSSGRSFRSSSTEVMLTSLASIEFPLHSPVRETLTPAPNALHSLA